MTVLIAFLAGATAGAAIYHRVIARQAERAHYDRYHREDIDRLAGERDNARNHWREALGIARRTRQRVTS